MRIHWIWFAMLPELNARQKLALLARFSDPEDIYHAAECQLKEADGMAPEVIKALGNKDLEDARKILKTCSDKDIGILAYSDDAYPSRLKNIDEPPMVLYYKGVLPDFEAVPVISVVGTRKATAYGLTTARTMGRQIAACGALVSSGGAGGIDTMAMQGALDAGCPVVGVLGCGVDVVYPASNRKLFKDTAEHGCLLSEYPPGTPPYKWHFPRRNRILSGMANGVLVVEAPQISGALITARQALEEGRDVFVVPGNIDVAACEGSNALLQGRAIAAFSGWDVVKEYAPLYPEKLEKRDVPSPLQELTYSSGVPREDSQRKVAQKLRLLDLHKSENDKKGIDNAANSNYSGINDPLPALSQEEKQIVSHLRLQPRPVDEVIAALGLPAGKVLGTLTMLALKGVVVNHPGKCVSLKREIPD